MDHQYGRRDVTWKRLIRVLLAELDNTSISYFYLLLVLKIEKVFKETAHVGRQNKHLVDNRL